MTIETRGIVLKDVKILGGKKLLTILTEAEGKITASSFRTKKESEKASLLPVALSNFVLEKKADKYKITSAKLMIDIYKISEDYEKFVLVSNFIKIINKVIPDGAQATEIFDITSEYLTEIVASKKPKYLAIFFMIKILKERGVLGDNIPPSLNEAISFFASKEYTDIKDYKLKKDTEDILYGYLYNDNIDLLHGL
jgi:DNA repair protein RecO (recombination protein O)